MKPQHRETTVLIASDWAPIRAFEPVIRRDPESVYGDLLPVLRRADLRIVNCECAMTAARRPVWKSGAVFKGEPGHVLGLTVVPFEVACLANNHVLDYGVAGLRESLDLLHRHGIRTVGAGLTETQAYAPLTVTRNGVRIHIINVSEGEDLTTARRGPGVCGWDPARTAGLIRSCKKRGGCVLVIGHCGLEYIPYPPPYVVAAFRAMIDAGADCVIGHHPHVPQGIEWYRGRPIAYSLGNFVFYQHTSLYYRKVGFCVSLRLRGDAIAGMDLHPYRLSATGLNLLTRGEERKFRLKLKRISRPLPAPAGADRAWNAYLAYYGINGFVAEVTAILETMNSEPRKGAAMFRNRITTLQHAELWRDLLTRVTRGDKKSYSPAAYRMIDEWFTKTADQDVPVS
jgi:poly-gamma-glutamate capsule biosynthesis protein CapA/YwtB (metallophosphatase superfamily)